MAGVQCYAVLWGDIAMK